MVEWRIPADLRKKKPSTYKEVLRMGLVRSMFKTFDQLQREVLTTSGLEEPLDVCLHNGKLYCMSNRRRSWCLDVHEIYHLLHLRTASNMERLTSFARGPRAGAGVWMSCIFMAIIAL